MSFPQGHRRRPFIDPARFADYYEIPDWCVYGETIPLVD
jgi:hypothetical protein